MSRKSLFLSLCACTFMISACESVDTSFSNGAPQLVAAPDSVTAMLADAADRASNALETLAAVEYARSPGVSVAPIDNAPIELRRAITVNWVGPADVIGKTLADRANYSFGVFGAAPPVPIVVSIDVENKPIIDVLRDLGLQLGLRGDVRVDSARRTVEIHYPPTTGASGS